MITRDGAKMSKSKGNVISPAPYVERYGADTARCYILFIGPPDQDADWSDDGVEGVHRFLGAALAARRRGGRATAAPHAAAGPRTSRRATTSSCCARRTGRSTRSPRDMAGRFAFNTAIAAVMELVNECYAAARRCSPATLRFAPRRPPR